ncbi:SRPBCC family protein [Paenibacillus sp. Leaf72]|uniref:SRPBCC family protein n=1 Tax=Paenibacillus sp. Leaf72 TaxID=1736234 RepID=UPI0006FA20EF|nr:SRPBCC family protein [Paenibacillus sp. Leaf72]KQO17176.1 hypothetical protein ASF12_00240 [Paenibacillus sp. Leaf72]
MHTYNEVTMRCEPLTAFHYARKIENWPQLLPHYRQIQFRYGGSERGGLVKMAAVRPFKRFQWPVWWESEMVISEEELMVGYRHVRGVTKGMEVEWRIVPAGEKVSVSIVHRWNAPPWSRRLFASFIGNWFVYAIAERTLQGLKQQAELEAALDAKKQAVQEEHPDSQQWTDLQWEALREQVAEQFANEAAEQAIFQQREAGGRNG